MDMAIEGMVLFLQSLPPGCMFKIISFGSDFEAMEFPEGSG
jgi:hypothetical protein